MDSTHVSYVLGEVVGQMHQVSMRLEGMLQGHMDLDSQSMGLVPAGRMLSGVRLSRRFQGLQLSYCNTAVQPFCNRAVSHQQSLR